MDESHETWISIADTAILLKVKPATVIKRIEKGSLPSRIHQEMPFTYDGKQNYQIPLSALPQRIQYRYIYSHLPEKDICSVDLASSRSKIGNVWLDEFLDISSIIRESTMIHREYHGTGNITEQLRKLAAKHGISLATLYRLIGKPASVEVSSLYTDPFYLRDHLPKTMCLWSCDLAYALYMDPDNQYKQNDIMREFSKKRCKVPCAECPYHPDNISKDPDKEVPSCPHAQDYMPVPNHRKTVNRLLKHIPHQMILFARKGYREWRAKYGLFVVRERPILTNEIWQSDHHVINCFIRVTLKKEKNEKIYEKEIAVRPVLTAWLDSATGYFVGWVISILPNSDTIAEAFCRAATVAPGKIPRGLPLKVILDCGADFRSRLLEDCPKEISKFTAEDTMLNKRFAGMGLLSAFGVGIIHNLPFHPQSKPLERYFGILEDKWISKLPGWCYESADRRPPDFQKKLEELLKQKKLLTMNEFVSYFENTILPEYHNMIDTETTIPELPGWNLSMKSMSPAQKYELLEKAKTITPDWSTISIMKMHHSPKHTVTRKGIRFSNTFYQADELGGMVDTEVDILFNRVCPPFAPASISVIHNNKYICEAIPAEIRHQAGDSSLDLTLDSDRQNRPAREMKSQVTRIRRSAEAILPDKAKSKPNEKNQLYDMVYAPSVPEEPVESIFTCPDSKKSYVQKGLSFLFGDDNE